MFLISLQKYVKVGNLLLRNTIISQKKRCFFQFVFVNLPKITKTD